MYVNRSYLCRPDRATARFHQASQPGRSLPFQPQDVHDQRQRVKDFLGKGGYLRGMGMELRHLRYFAASVREGSVTRAAKTLNMAQPPLSRQLQQLEEELGAVLIERGSRPLRVTDAGRFFYEHALSILDRAEALKMMTRRVGQIDKGRFGIGFVGSILYGPLPGMIRRFHATYPDLDIEMLELTSVQQVSALKEGQIDIGFGRLHIDDPAIEREVLIEEPLVAALPIGHPLLDDPGPLRRDEVVYRPLQDGTVTSPIILCSRKHDHSRQLAALLKLVRDLYRTWDTGPEGTNLGTNSSPEPGAESESA